MQTINPSSNTAKENYKLLIGSIIPRPIAFVTSLSAEGILNGAPFSFFNAVGEDPPMISLSINRIDGRKKDTTKNILETKEFVVHIADEDNIEQINQTAASLPSNQSEIELAGLTPVKSNNISVPGIQESKIRMECILEHAITLGEQDSLRDFIIGKVVQFHFADDIYTNGKINPRRLGAVSRLAGTNYASIGDIFPLKRPE
ncbi:flavin reductase family protein [Virgibacillus halophilus]|uniref:Flavin reductase family protein n=1 Tax=Tigheibacillus halophilus TaxID=361280 RepID=A0ABU5C6Q8_9BACI|nr:flavin reductase family protein [Virgibacillus halophilus]